MSGWSRTTGRCGLTTLLPAVTIMHLIDAPNDHVVLLQSSSSRVFPLCVDHLAPHYSGVQSKPKEINDETNVRTGNV